jgi:prepilin-type N-terminal cleavage/methylation domain-containing protein
MASVKQSLGFTLIELLITIAIMAIVMGIAAPSMSRIMANLKLRDIATTTELAIKEARTQAFITQRNTQLTFDLDSDDADSEHRLIVALLSPEVVVTEHTLDKQLVMTNNLVVNTTNNALSFTPKQFMFQGDNASDVILANTTFSFCLKNRESDKYLLTVTPRGKTDITISGSCS